jgi:hypothetical protein
MIPNYLFKKCKFEVLIIYLEKAYLVYILIDSKTFYEFWIKNPNLLINFADLSKSNESLNCLQ